VLEMYGVDLLDGWIGTARNVGGCDITASALSDVLLLQPDYPRCMALTSVAFL
jgi:hypothetical protein